MSTQTGGFPLTYIAPMTVRGAIPEYPNFWVKPLAFYVPGLGVKGLSLPNVARRAHKGVFADGLDGSAWTRGGGFDNDRIPSIPPPFVELPGGSGAGNADNISCGTAINPSGTQITIAFWVYLKSLNSPFSDNRVFSKSASGSAATNHIWAFTGNTGGTNPPNWRFRIKISGTTQTLVADDCDLQNNRWVFGAGVYDGNTVRVFNAPTVATATQRPYELAQVASLLQTGSIDQTDDELLLGNQPGYNNGCWHGYLGPIYIWDRCLPLTELRVLVRHPLAPVMTRMHTPSSQRDVAPAAGPPLMHAMAGVGR